MITVYDLEGLPHEKHPIDAKECVSVLGWTLSPKEEKEPEKLPEKKSFK